MKTRQFKDDKYVGDPLNAVKIFNEKEVDELAIYDIDATVKGTPPDLAFLEKIAIESRMPLCVGGGINGAEQAAELIRIGFEKVSISSAALVRPALINEIASRIGRQSVVVTLDVKKDGLGGYSVMSHNGSKKHEVKLTDFISEASDRGAGEIVINSIDRDGMMQGYDLALAKLARTHTSTPLTLLGGAGSVDDMSDLIDAVGTIGAAAGSMFVFKGVYRAVLISYGRP